MAAHKAYVLTYLRHDGKWAWHLKSGANIIATDGGQGYENESDCQDMAEKVVGGSYAFVDYYRSDEPSDGDAVPE